MHSRTQAENPLRAWVEVARSIWTPALSEHAPRAFQYVVPTTSAEGEAIDAYFANPDVLYSVDPSSPMWSNIGEAFGLLVRTEVTADQHATSAELYYCCGVVGLFLVGRTRLVDEDSVAHAMIGAAHNVQKRRDGPCRRLLQTALSVWPLAFCHESRNELPSVLASALVDLGQQSEQASANVVAKLHLLLDQFDIPLDGAKAMVAALVK